MSPRIVAFVPMRHNSERVMGKNYRIFAGRPLYHYIVEALLNSPRIAEVVIDTDSPIIMEDVPAAFPTVRVLERPAHLRDGAISMNTVLMNSVAQVPAADYYLQTHSTNPLLTTERITAAVDTFLAADGKYDSLFSVTRLQTRLWSPEGTPLNHDANVLLRTQDLPPVYEENSCLYLFTDDVLRRRHSRIGDRPLLYEIPRDEAADIDVEFDFTLAELMYQHGR